MIAALSTDIGQHSIGDREVTHLLPEKRDTGMFSTLRPLPAYDVTQKRAFVLEMRKLSASERD